VAVSLLSKWLVALYVSPFFYEMEVSSPRSQKPTVLQSDYKWFERLHKFIGKNRSHHL